MGREKLTSLTKRAQGFVTATNFGDARSQIQISRGDMDTRETKTKGDQHMAAPCSAASPESVLVPLDGFSFCRRRRWVKSKGISAATTTRCFCSCCTRPPEMSVLIPVCQRCWSPKGVCRHLGIGLGCRFCSRYRVVEIKGQMVCWLLVLDFVWIIRIASAELI